VLVVESWKDVAITRKNKKNDKLEVSNELKTMLTMTRLQGM
jgi:hypothetical protein